MSSWGQNSINSSSKSDEKETHLRNSITHNILVFLIAAFHFGLGIKGDAQ